MKTLLVDDEKILRVTVGDSLTDAGHIVSLAEDGKVAISMLDSDFFDCVITDLNMPFVSGEEVLSNAISKDVEVVVITGVGSVASAVSAMRLGAFDYIEKPFEIDELLLILSKIEKVKKLKDEVKRLRLALDREKGFSRVIGDSKGIVQALEIAKKASGVEAGILIEGESGTGKEVIAKAIYEESDRCDKAFVVISCGVLSESLLESELFGHEKGAFTGAENRRRGRFEMADGGIVFLDDIDDMPFSTQVKLLRVLQEGTVERVGSTESINVDIRVIAATKVDLKKMVDDGKFREDLYYRLDVIKIILPPLRDRIEDIPILAANFIAKHGKGVDYKISEQAMIALKNNLWQGNIRELENAILRAIMLCGDNKELSVAHLLPSLDVSKGKINQRGDKLRLSLKAVVDDAEKVTISAALEETNGNKTEAAKLLGVSRKHLWTKMVRLGM